MARSGLLPGRHRGRVPLVSRRVLALSVAVAALTYLVGLGAVHIPSIGDEPYYLQIARRTAESGQFLPLLSDTGVTDTKPPLIFWTGIASSKIAGGFSLASMRLPSVVLTFLAAALLAFLAYSCSGRLDTALLASLLYLGFRSTVQHGRPFLTNPGEVLFLLVPLALIFRRERTGLWLTLLAGLSLGLAALTKSFFLLVPGTLGPALVLLRRSGWSLGKLVRNHGGFLAGSALLGLAFFSLWPLFDPRPDLIYAKFILGENVSKLSVSRFLTGLVSGPWPIWRIWLAPVVNAGALTLPVVALAKDLFRRRRELTADEKDLLLYVLAFFLVYSVPTQRQENYVLPAMGAIAVLLALRWEALPSWATRISLALLALLSVAGVFIFEVALGRVHAAVPASAFFLAAALFAGGCAGVFSERLARDILPSAALAMWLLLTIVGAPFDGPFSQTALEELRQRPVTFPSRFQREEELYRYLLPGADLRPYPCPGGPVRCPLPEGLPASRNAAVYLQPGEPVPQGYEEIAEIPHLRTRHAPSEVFAMIFGGRLDLLVERLVLLRPGPQGGVTGR